MIRQIPLGALCGNVRAWADRTRGRRVHARRPVALVSAYLFTTTVKVRVSRSG